MRDAGQSVEGDVVPARVLPSTFSARPQLGGFLEAALEGVDTAVCAASTSFHTVVALAALVHLVQAVAQASTSVRGAFAVGQQVVFRWGLRCTTQMSPSTS